MPDIKEKLVELMGLNIDYGLADILAAHLIANGVTIQKWISVEERLPEEDLLALIVVSGKPRKNITLDGAYELATYSGEEGWILEEWPEWEGAQVSHWMPLPEPPKEEI